MDRPGKTWLARFISLTLFAALCSVFTCYFPNKMVSSPSVTIQTNEEQSVVLKRLADAGVDADEIKIQKHNTDPLFWFASYFLLFGLAQAVFLAVHSTVKSVVVRGSSTSGVHSIDGSRPDVSAGSN